MDTMLSNELVELAILTVAVIGSYALGLTGGFWLVFQTTEWIFGKREEAPEKESN